MKNLLTIFICILLAAISNHAKATHVFGAEITCSYAFADSFDVTLIVYRDCNGISISNSPITVTSATTSAVNYTLTLVSTTDVTGLGPNCGPSRCSGSYPYGIEEWVYKGRIRLIAGSSCEYTISWEQCCRNSTITTGAAGAYFYVESMINACVSPKNSSPVFSNTPRFLLPVGQDASISFNATDADGDLLTYELIDPKSGASSPISYTGNWTSSKPVTFLGFPNKTLSFPAGFHVDTSTGIIKFRPTKLNEVTVIVMKVTEWRVINGNLTKLGEVTRDIQYIIINMPNNKVPAINTSNTSNGSNPNISIPQIAFCGGPGTYCVDIPVSDNDTNDTLNFAYAHKLNNIIFTNIGTVTKPVIRACATFDSAELASGKPLTFTMTAFDNACPIPGKVSVTFELAVKPHMPDSFVLDKNLACRKLDVKLINNSASKNVYAWFDINSTNNTFKDSVKTGIAIDNTPDSGWYGLKMKVYSPDYCDTRTYTDSIEVPGANFFSIKASNDTLLCNDPKTTLGVNTTRGTTPFVYAWSGPQTANTQTIAITAPTGKQKYFVKVTDSHGCEDFDTVDVRYYDPQVVISGDSAVCKNKSVTLSATLINSFGGIYRWTGYPQGQNTINPAITASQQFVFTLADGSGCLVTKTHTVFASSPAFTYSHKSGFCVGDSVRLSGTPGSGITPYTVYWNSTGQNSNTITLPPGTSASNYYFSVEVKDALGCSKTQNDFVVINPLPTVTTTPPGTYCKNSGPVSLSSFGSPAGGIWNGTGVSGNYFNTFNTPGNYTLSYTYTDVSTGCTAAQSTALTLNDKPVAGFTASSTSGGLPLNVQFFNSTTGTAGSWQWEIRNSSGTVIHTATTKDITYTFTSKGNYSVKLIAINTPCNDTVEKTNYINVFSTGIAGVSASRISIYPNPATNKVIAEGDEISAVKLFDMQGREINIETAAISNNKSELYFGKIDAGMYLLYLYDKSGHTGVYKLQVE